MDKDFRRFIYQLSQSLETKDSQGINLLLDLPFSELKSPIETMNYLINEKIITPSKLNQLIETLITIGRDDLVDMVEAYKTSGQPTKDVSERDEVYINTRTAEPTPEDMDDAAYQMDRKPTGFCIIFNNNSFPHERSRETLLDNASDCQELFLTFQWLGFLVEAYENCSKNDMLNKLQRFLTSESNNKMSCLVVVILSLGRNGLICAADGEKINIKEDIVDFIATDDCKHLSDKPKLFFIQASAPPEHVLKSCEFKNCDCKNESDKNFIAADRDIFIFSSKISNVMPEARQDGSIFIQRLCHILQKHAKSKYFYEILLKVNKYIDKKIGGHNEPFQGIFDMNTLQKKIKFKPEESYQSFLEKSKIMQDSSGR